MKEDKTMVELRKIKRQISKELYGKSFEEVDKYLKESSRIFNERYEARKSAEILTGKSS